MKTFGIKSPEIEINKDNPFEQCRLKRKKYAMILTNLVSSDNEGFVLALNNKWGEGKTTFIKMWSRHLEVEKFSTIMFNAWENDFVSNPLIALVAEFKNLNTKDVQGFEKVLEKASYITKGLFPTLAKAIANKYLDIEEIEGLIDGTVDSVEKAFKIEVDEYEIQKQSIVKFKKELSKYVADNSNNKPVIFIIDELDRCRPDYAVSILESIKHLFSVPNVVFVLSIDKIQLENAICGVYGSDNINSVEYLRKFIDIEYSLPKPKPNEYYEFLYTSLDFDSYFNSQPKLFNYIENTDKNSFKVICMALMGNITLRNQEKILTHIRISLMLSGDVNQTFFPTLYVFLVYCKMMERDFYNQILSQEIDLQDAQKSFNEVCLKIKKSNNRIFSILEAWFLVSYCSSVNKGNEVFKIVEGKDVETQFTSSFDDPAFRKMLVFIGNYEYYHQIKMTTLLNKINLVDDFNLDNTTF